MNRREFAKVAVRALGAIAVFPLADKLAQAAVASGKPNRRVIDNGEYVKEEFIQGDIEFRSGAIVNCSIVGTIYCLTSAPKQMLGCNVKAPEGRPTCVWISKEAVRGHTVICDNCFDIEVSADQLVGLDDRRRAFDGTLLPYGMECSKD